MTKIVKNATGSEITLKDVGIVIAASSQYLVYENEYPLWAAATLEGPDSELTTLIKSGDIVINDGAQDLSIAVGIIHMQTGIRIVQASIEDETPGTLDQKLVSGTGVSVAVIGTTNKQLQISANFDTLPHPSRLYYCAINGDDTLGDGTFYKPWRTIKYALSQITATSTNRATLKICPGLYVEANPLVVPEYVMVEGEGKGVVQVYAGANDKVFVLNGFSRVQNMHIIGNGGTSVVGIYMNTPGILAQAWDITFIDTYVGINVDAYCFLVTYNMELFTSTHGISVGALVTNSGQLQVTAYSCTTTPGIPVGIALKLDGAGVVASVTSIKFDTANLVQGLDVRNGAYLNLDSFTMVNVDLGLDLDNAKASVSSGRVTGTLGARMDNAAEFEGSGVDLHECTLNIQVLDYDTRIFLAGGEISRDRVMVLPGFAGSAGYFIDRKVADEGLVVYAELAVGRPDLGSESVFGQGDSYTIGMNVITTDNTCTSTTDGGNYIDVSALASEVDTDYFSFQGTTANHCIYLSSDVNDGTDYVRFFGIKITPVVAAVEATRKSFVFEYWDGSAWVSDGIMATHSSLFYSYANEVFIRANSNEHIRFGRALGRDCVKKTFNGKERYWVRIRITNDLTTAPTFNQFKLSSSRTEINSDGTVTMHGKSRFVEALTFQTNTFGETGGVTNSKIDVGLGVPPYAWEHVMKNNRLNGEGDAIYAMNTIPEGTCTACGISVKVKYIALQSGASTDGQMTVSFLPLESSGIPVADRAGGLTPVLRSHSNTRDVDAYAAQIRTLNIHLTEDMTIHTADVGYFDIADFYEGDMMFIRIQYKDDGSAKKDLAILGFEIEGVKWRLGGRP